jgi:hypothetical protein
VGILPKLKHLNLPAFPPGIFKMIPKDRKPVLFYA